MTDKWTDVVSKLIAKASDPATPEVERAALMDKAYYLMAKFNIEEDMLNFGLEKPEEAIRRNINVIPPYVEPKRRLLNSAAVLFGCRTVQDFNKVMIFGFERDQDNTVLLYGSIVVQLLDGVERAIKTERPKGMHGKTFNHAWTIGFADMVHERVVAMKKQAHADVQANTEGNGMELVLVDKQNKISKLILTEVGRTHTIRNFHARLDSGVYGAGRAAGAQADLGQTRIGRTGTGRTAIGN